LEGLLAKSWTRSVKSNLCIIVTVTLTSRTIPRAADQEGSPTDNASLKQARDGAILHNKKPPRATDQNGDPKRANGSAATHNKKHTKKEPAKSSKNADASLPTITPELLVGPLSMVQQGVSAPHIPGPWPSNQYANMPSHPTGYVNLHNHHAGYTNIPDHHAG
jgi:hypothetical protein